MQPPDEFDHKQPGPYQTPVPLFPWVEIDPDPSFDEPDPADKPPSHRLFNGIAIIVVVTLILAGQTRGFSLRNSSPSTVALSGLTYCGTMSDDDHKRLEQAAEVMRTTDEGKSLEGGLIAHKTCIEVEKLDPDVAGVTEIAWNGSQYAVTDIAIAQELPDRLRKEELAAVLVHEAMHARRTWLGENCVQTDACETLSNGVELEEEEAAHAAEARFWIALYGSGGYHPGILHSMTGDSLFLNNLVDAYESGPDAFRKFVKAYREDDL